MHLDEYLHETSRIIDDLDRIQIASMIEVLSNLNGRLFVLGLGGSAAHASHAVNDFRKICGIEAYTPLDNVAELTAHINDDSWEDCLVRWLENSRLVRGDAVLVFSVGGGSGNVSQPIVRAVNYARLIQGATVLGITGPDGGHVAEYADVCIRIPAKEDVTPHTEGITAVLWHLIVTCVT